MQEDNHVFQGLRRDNHQIRQDAKFLWDAHNIRLTNREDNTLLSITNEKGTSAPLVTLQGYYVGHCVLGKYLVVFTANNDYTDNYIYRVEKVGSGYKTIVLFHKVDAWKGAWDPNHPIEAIGVYETELVQKVYWVDSRNQPRVINIAKPELKLPKYIDVGGTKQELLIDGVNLSGPIYSENPNIDQYLYYKYPRGLYLPESFDFVRDIHLGEEVQVHRGEGSGVFSPGTIQYAFSYYNKYEQESNIFHVTPINYISPVGRGGSPEEKVANFFTIDIYDTDVDFEYIRIYSIHRTSIDSVPTVKIVTDIPMEGRENITFIDDGTKGTTIDPTQLLYIGGRSIVAGCITSKDNTLFLGNIKLNSSDETYEDVLKEDWEPDDWELTPIGSTGSTGSTYYDYVSPLSQGYLAGFKSGERYRCGVQVQTSDGVWSDPIFMADLVLNPSFEPATGNRTSGAITFLNTENLVSAGIKRIRACVVFPRAYERDVICQGVLCPTVYNVSGRNIDSPYAMSSWFFRPATDTAAINNSSDVYHGASVQFQHNKPLFTGGDRGAEVQNMISDSSIVNINSITSENYNKFKPYFFVDENIVTFHSPDIEFDSQIQNMDWSNVELNIIGLAYLDAISGDIDIQTKSPVANVSGTSSGYQHTQIGYQTRNSKFINGGLISGLFYESGQLDSEYNVSTGKYFMVYPWHRSGSLNNDSNRPEGKGSRSAVLSKKVISNLKFFPRNVNIDTIFNYKISTPVLFNSNELNLLKIRPLYLDKDVPYMGNVDTLSTSSDGYPFYIGANFHDSNVVKVAGNSTEDKPLIASTTEPVRIKYKSSPHLVFSLSGDSLREIKLLPRHASIGGTSNGEFTFPDWQNTGSSDGSNDDRDTYDGDFSHVDSGVFAGYNLSQYNVGRYAYDRPWGAADGKYSVAVGQVGADGKVRWVYTGHEGKILRVVKDFTISSRKHGDIIPGITSSDWGGKYGNSYIGETKYYRVVSDGFSSNGFPYYKLEQVSTSAVKAMAPSRAGGKLTYTLSQSSFGDRDTRVPPYLLIAELIRHVPSSVKFGGDTEEAKRQNIWFPAGRPVMVSGTGSTTVPFEYGDTWYSRYDCLKTYPFTHEDENQVVEIGSFMCETRVNIDGRYDRNRGQLSNLNMTPQNFNLLNEVYSQRDNFFNYRILDRNYYRQHKFANQITWSKEKHAGEEIDTWANITLANIIDMDGEKGEVTSLRTWNEYLLCFQEKALSQILFNSRVQIPTTDGVPIEISNGYKVDGSRLLSGNIGCSNKWATATTSTGVYFLDSNTDSLYIFNGQLANLSEDRGMDWWVRQNHTDKIWKPVWHNVNTLNGIRSFYDNKYGDIYFTPGQVNGIDQPDALCYSEQLGQFTSLMSYGGTQAMFNFANSFYSLRETDGNVKLYENNVGDYNNFYGITKGWDFSFISNQNPTLTKVFDTIELRADRYNGDTLVGDKYLTQSQPGQPFNFIRVNNEYQDTRWYDEDGSHDVMCNYSNFRKKFRVWRGLIPRNHSTRQRIRNPWTKVTLGWTPRDNRGFLTEGQTDKVVVHDVSVKYTI